MGAVIVSYKFFHSLFVHQIWDLSVDEIIFSMRIDLFMLMTKK